jgi:hypothetical protein
MCADTKLTIQQFCSVNSLSCCSYNPDWIHGSIVDIAFTDKNIFVRFTRILINTRTVLFQFFRDNNY